MLTAAAAATISSVGAGEIRTVAVGTAFVALTAAAATRSSVGAGEIITAAAGTAFVVLTAAAATRVFYNIAHSSETGITRAEVTGITTRAEAIGIARAAAI